MRRMTVWARGQEGLPRPLARHVDRATSAFLSSVIDSIPLDFGGGSGLSKAHVFAALIEKYRLKSFVEIGVYRGRSLLPVAALFKRRGEGVAIGVDPYTFTAAEQHDTDLFPEAAAQGVTDWNRAMDWDGLYAEVMTRIHAVGLEPHCRLVRATSTEAANQFAPGSIDIVHIDGNHDRAAVRLDVETYLPKVRPGGFILLDDAWWVSVQDARRLVASQCHEVHADRESDFVVFRLPGEGRRR
jgi:predicted O-methyltransferase YrrM